MPLAIAPEPCYSETVSLYPRRTDLRDPEDRVCLIHGIPKIKNKGRGWRCRTCIREMNRRCRDANPEKYREKARRWRAENPERVRELSRERMRRVHGYAVQGSLEHRVKTSGENSYAWKGDDASRRSIHNWLDLWFPKTGRCHLCGVSDDRGTDYAFLRHPEKHTRNRDDYVELCPPCHVRMDAFDRKARSFGIRVIRG